MGIVLGIDRSTAYSVDGMLPEDDPYHTTPGRDPPVAPEAPTLGFPWLKGSIPGAMNLEILKAEVPAFFHEGYSVEPDASEDLLYKAIYQQDEAKVRTLLRNPVVEVNGPLQCVPYTPLHIACEVGNVNIVRAIKEQGANVNYESDGYSPLVTACRHGHEDVVNYLLECGAYVDQRAGKEIIPGFIKSSLLSDLNTPRRQRSRQKFSPDRVGMMLVELADPYWGNTALIQACREQHVSIARELLRRGGSVDGVNMAGNTALHVACLSRTANTHVTVSSPYIPSTVLLGGHRDVVRLLLDAGAHPDARNAHGETPLERSFRLLADRDDPLSIADWGFSSAEQLVLFRGLLHVVRQLLIAGCHVRGGSERNQWLQSAAAPAPAHASARNPRLQRAASSAVGARNQLQRASAASGTSSLDVMWTVSQLARVGQEILQHDTEKTLHGMFEDTLLLFYECVYISGCYFPWDELEAVLMGEQELDEDFRDRLLAIHCRLFSLAKCCRIVIRQTLPMPICKTVTQLPIPHDTQRFILFSDMDY